MIEKAKIDSGKFYSSFVKLCWITIACYFVIKIFGYKGLEIPYLDSSIELNVWVRRFINLIFYCFNGVCFSLILIKRKFNSKELLLIILLQIPLYVLFLFNIFLPLKLILEPLLLFIIGKIILKDKSRKILIESVIIYIIYTIYQAITMFYKNFNIEINPNKNFIIYLILDLDYYTLMIMTILSNFKKGGYIYERWITLLDFLSKQKGNKQPMAKNPTSIQQGSKKDDVGFKLFVVMLSICQIVLVGTICYFVNNVIWEYVIIILSFFVLREVFGKSFHTDSVLTCTLLATLTFLIATRLSLPSWLSIFCNVFIGALVAYVMHILYYYKKYTSLDGITLCKGMSKENLLKVAEMYNFNELEINLFTYHYVDKMSLFDVAYEMNYSVETIKRYKKKALEKLK